MNLSELKQLQNYFEKEDNQPVELIETHISWIFLTKLYAYKLKKPIKLSFLDFSELESRKFFCDKELRLNRRLAEQVYIEVCPVYSGGTLTNSQNKMPVIDYAIKMQRLDSRRQMQELLNRNLVKAEDIIHLALKVARFHKEAEITLSGFSPTVFIKKFNDILNFNDTIEKHLGKADFVKKAAMFSENFINENKALLKSRHEVGYTRDCHGDLHAGNIFIYDDPVIFDCLEFNDDYRIIDVLNDVAFFCMDMEARGHYELSRLFLETYIKEFPCMEPGQNEQKLFLYYKLYRAEVRAKVNAIAASQTKDPLKLKESISECDRYLRLMEKYINDIK